MPDTQKKRIPSLRNGRIWPVTITRARYGATYSGAQWHAWGCYPWEIPQDAYGSDPTCASFWGLSLSPDEESDVWDKDEEDVGLLDYRGAFESHRVECEADKYVIGKGRTHEEAYDDLVEQTKDLQ